METAVKVLSTRELTAILSKGGFIKAVTYKAFVTNWTSDKGYRIEKVGFYTYYSAIGERLSRTFTCIGEYVLVCGTDEKHSVENLTNYLQEKGLLVKVQGNKLIVSNGTTLKYEKTSVDVGHIERISI
jgi:ribosomal protein S16